MYKIGCFLCCFNDECYSTYSSLDMGTFNIAISANVLSSKEQFART